MSDTQEAMLRVIGHLLSGRPEVEHINLDDDLIEGRILDSLGFVEFLCLLEELTGREIALEDVTPDDFRTLTAIERRFFSDELDHER